MTPERQQRIEAVLAKRQGNLTIVMENVSDPHNISAVMRTADAVGIQDIFVLNTNIPKHRKWGQRSSSSAAKWLTIHQFEDFSSCLQALRANYNQILTTHLASDSRNLFHLDLTQSTALVFGNEHSGVSEEMVAAADGNFIIPQAGMIRSLNISVACAVTLYEAFRQKTNAGHYEAPNLPTSQYESLHHQWSLNLDEQSIS